MPAKIKHIAVFRLSAMGDVAMVVPVIRLFVAQNPTVLVTVVSRPFFKPFFDDIKNVRFFAVDITNRHKGLIGLCTLFLDLKKLHIDAFADLHNVLRSKVVRVLFAINGTKTAFTDKGRAEKKQLTRSKNKIFKPLKTMFLRHVDTFAKLGFIINVAVPVYPDKTILTDEILSISGNKNSDKWIGIAPFAQYKSKVYPLDLMQTVIDELALQTKNKIFLFGGGNHEIELLNKLAKHTKNIIVVAGKLNLQNELHLMSSLDVLLSMDSGNAHMAAMLGVKVVTLWGATHPYAGFSPYNQPLEHCLVANRLEYTQLPTSIYGNKIVAGYENAMRSISTTQIIKKIEAVL